MVCRVDEIIGQIGETNNLNLQGMEGSSPAYLLSRLWCEKKRPLLIVCSNNEEAQKLKDDIEYFSGSDLPCNVSLFTGPETLPYTHLIPQPDIWIDRLRTIYEIENSDISLVIAPITALLRKITPKELFYDHIDYLSVGQTIDKEKFLERLVFSGYNNSPLVEDEGDFASRGYIVDLWSPTSDRPVRIELDGDQIASIRGFDPTTQRASFSLSMVTIIPVRSVILTEEVVTKGLKQLKKIADDIGVSAVERREYASSVKSGVYPAYTETLLPIFHPDSSFLWDYLKDDTLVFILNPPEVKEKYANFWKQLLDAYREASHIEKIVKPTELYSNYQGWEKELEERIVVRVNDLELTEGSGLDIRHLDNCLDVKCRMSRPDPSVAPGGKWIEGSSATSANQFVEKLNAWRSDNQNVIVVCHTPMQADRVVDIARWQGVNPESTNNPFFELISGESPHFYVTVGDLSEGFVWRDEGIVVLTEKEIFGKKKKKVISVPKFPTESFSSYKELEEGNFLVHIKHGVGRYHGMKQMKFGEMTNDFLQIEYLGGDKLYVPAYRLGQVQKYVGPGDSAPFLDKLGGMRWEKAKLKANRAVRKMAGELLRLYATRKIKPGFAFSGRDHLMEEFEAAFPYDETPDQMSAIDDVIKDMSEPHPTDRLICGDVGYGKTEVAMRAAFRGVMDEKQVAFLVPTTILAFQHYETLKERFKGTAINIEYLNRFKTKKEQARVVKGLAAGTIDIVVGTHRLIQRDVSFRDLGLLIVDEEHRFGVRQKELIKGFRATVDVISMSATPIPRTLHISLVGARDISVINTPPADRRAIRTYVAEFDEGLVRGAIVKELRRGGQIFFLHNRVETIESMKIRLSKIVPEARVCIGHGQMKEHELERVMVKFLKKEYDVLLCTTIIESGLDIPSANTIIVNRADTFGLSQLYQIRGRVGRSNVQAFAYLLIPEESAITSIASKRLAALQRYTELGSGFQIAMHDLEIRGSGNILGAQQSGHISAIGYELYTGLLEREIRKLKGEKSVDEIDTEIQMPVEAYLPADYVEDNGTRIVFYKRISAIKSDDEIFDMERELVDRFGELPDVAKNLLKVVEIKARASKLGVESIQVNKGIFVYTFSESTPIAPQKLLELIRSNHEKMKITSKSAVVISEKIAANKEIFSFAGRHLEMFQGCMVERP